MPTTSPINNLPVMCMGSNPVDGKNLVLEEAEYEQLVANNPEAGKFIKRYMGGEDFLTGNKRYCLWLDEANEVEARKIEFINSRLESCALYRKSAGRDAQKTADKPYRFCYRTHQNATAIIFPKTSAASRAFIPAGFTDENTVINVDAFAIYNADPYVLGLLSSTLHRVWLSLVAGRLGNGYRYSVKIAYNNFPVPNLSESNKQAIEDSTWEIVSAREQHPGKTIAWLYDRQTMPVNLLDAHKSLDEAIEKIYIGRAFKNDTERIEHLLKLYANLLDK